ncbi:hypothetical protein TB1_045131 [Malus domestica]
MLNDGPEVSLIGSSMVSLIIAALCGSAPFGSRLLACSKALASMYFLALSHAPPVLEVDIAIKWNHLLNGCISGDLETGSIVGLNSTFHETWNDIELHVDFLNHF